MVVKGLSKRVVVVKSPDPKVFEEAIFIVRDDFLAEEGVTSADLIKEAQKIAASYARSSPLRSRQLISKLPAPAFAAAGAAVTGIAWLAMRLVGV